MRRLVWLFMARYFDFPVTCGLGEAALPLPEASFLGKS